jgi:hypothetical protein
MRKVILVVWAATLTLVMQLWVGGATIYRPELAPRVEAAHRAILENVPPDGKSWSASGMNTVNIRVIAVWAAEFMHRSTGLSVTKSYRLLDTVGLFAGLMLLIPYLRLGVSAPYAIIGALFFGTLLPLTYQLFFFHPWDRLGLVSWLALLWLLRQDRILPFALLLPVSVALKFDVILLPGLFLLFRFVRGDAEKARTILVTALLFAVSFGTYLGLQWWRPGGSEAVPAALILHDNIASLRGLNIAYPPLLAFAVPVVLALSGFSRLTAWAKACLLFGMGLLVIYALRSMLAEYRTEVPVMLLFLPAMLESLAALLTSEEERERDA